jgi:predicted PurR-regulated permease PerM
VADMNNDPETLKKTKLPWGVVLSIYLIAFMATTAVLMLGKSYFLPVVLAFFLYFLASPLSRKFQKLGLTTWISSFLTVILVMSSLCVTTYHSVFPFYHIFQSSSSSLKSIERKIIELKRPMKVLTEAQNQIEKMTEIVKDKSMHVTVNNSSFEETLFNQAQQIVFNFATITVLFFFFLLYGDEFLIKLGRNFPLSSKLEGRSPILANVKKSTFFYLITVSIINTVLGFCIGTVLFLLGFPDPFLWGLIAGLLNFIPYIGCLLGAFMVFLISLTTFDTTFLILLPPLSYFVLNSIEGQFITPLILGKALLLNPLVILFSVLYWGAIWGIAGLFVAVPMLIILKIICDHTPSLHTIAETLGE